MRKLLAALPPHCLPQPIPDVISWFIPVLGVLVFSSLQVFATCKSFAGRQRLIELAFLVNLAIEAGVAMRCQFPHSFDVIKIHCILTTISAGVALLCQLFDSYVKYMRFVPMRAGIPHNGWPARMRHGGARFYHLAERVPRVDYVRIHCAFLQLVFRILESLLRFLGPRDGRNCGLAFFVTSGFSVVPLLIAMSSWATTRMIENRKRTPRSMDLMIIGTGSELRQRQEEDRIPAPSPFLRGVLNIENPTTNLKCFDMWSTTVIRNGEDLTLNIWEIRESANVETAWKLPSVDFIILYFSLTGPAPSKNVQNGWIEFFSDRAPRVSVVLVGTDLAERNQRINDAACVTSAQGENLAVRLKATTYIECNINQQDILIGRLLALIA